MRCKFCRVEGFDKFTSSILIDLVSATMIYRYHRAFQLVLVLSCICRLSGFPLTRKDSYFQVCRQLSKSTTTCRSSSKKDTAVTLFYSSLSNRDISDDQQTSSVEFPVELSSASEFDSILHDFNEVMDSEMFPLSDEQLLDSLLHSEKKSHHTSGAHFATVLKTLAARRYQLDGDRSFQKRRQLVQALMAQISAQNDGVKTDKAQSAEVISNCLWAMGTLKVTKEDFFSPNPVLPSSATDNSSSNVATWEKGTNNWEVLLTAVTQLCGGLDNEHEDINTAHCMSRVQLFRLISGLGKMGLKWTAMPQELQSAFLWNTSNIASTTRSTSSAFSMSSTSEGSIACEGPQLAGTDSLEDALELDAGIVTDTASLDTSRDTSREIASSLYILGQIGATKDLLPEGYLQVLVSQLNQDHVIQGFTGPGLFNALHGLARLQLSWSADIPAALQRRLLARSRELAGKARLDEFCSFLKSIAVLKVDWSALSAPLQTLIVRTLLVHLLAMNCRETIVAVWSLGKLGLSFRDLNRAAAASSAEQSDHTDLSETEHDHLTTSGAHELGVRSADAAIPGVTVLAASADDGSRLRLLARLRAEMLIKLESVTPQMTLFDSESLLLALGLMEIQYGQLPTSYFSGLQKLLLVQLPHMNIFNLHNVLWGLARIKAEVHAPVPAVSGTKSAQQTLGAALWQCVLKNFHIFLPVHFGDILWSLGVLGFSVKAPSTVTLPELQRMLAVLSRVYNKLPVRGATYVLCGLARMNVRWKDHLSVCPPPTNATYGNRTFVMQPVPLADSVLRYLRTRTGSMREHEFAVTLAALGRIGARWSDLPAVVTGKLGHRITKVGPHFTSRSLCNTLQGMAHMKVTWEQLSEQSRFALEDALLMTTTATDENTDGDVSKRTGLRAMRNRELAATIHSLSNMNAEWDSLCGELQTEILQTTARRVYSRSVNFRDRNTAPEGSAMDYELTAVNTLTGLCGMHSPADLVPVPVVSACAAQLRQLHLHSAKGPLDEPQQLLYLQLISGLAHMHRGGEHKSSSLLEGVPKTDLRRWLEGLVEASTKPLRQDPAPATTEAEEPQPPTVVQLSPAEMRLQEQKEAWLALIHRGTGAAQSAQSTTEPVAVASVMPEPYNPTVAAAALEAFADLGGSWQELASTSKEAVVILLAASQRHSTGQGNKHQEQSISKNNKYSNVEVDGALFTVELLQKLFSAVSRMRQKTPQ